MSAEKALDASEQPPYRVVLSPCAHQARFTIAAKSDRQKVKKMLQLLDTVPEIGRVYDPDYPAAQPPFEMRVTFAGRYGIYYTVEEAEKTVRVLFIEDQRRDPLNRFYGIYPHEEK